jgi:zinc protease
MRFLLSAALLSAAAFGQVGMPPPLIPANPAPAARPARPAAPRGPAAPAYKELKYPALRLPQAPEAARFQLSNGMKVVLVENHETPAVTGAALVRTGAVYEPADRAGLAALTGALIRAGGSRLKSPDDLDAELAAIGASIDSGIGDTMGSVTFSVLKENLAPSLTLFRDLLTTPAFRSDRLDLAKSSILNGIARRNDDVRQVLRRELLRAVHPQTHQPEYGTVAPLRRPDVVQFYQRYFFPSNTILVVSGDFQTEEMKGVLEVLFGNWKSDQPPVAELPKAETRTGGAFLIAKPDARLNFVAMGAPGGTYLDPDAAALDVTATILGAGARSRLRRRPLKPIESVENILAEAYPGFVNAGLFGVTGTAGPGAAADVVTVALDELQKLRTAEPTEEELRLAREIIWFRAAEGLDNPARVALAIGTADYYGYPADYIQQYLKRVAAVSRADVLRVAKEKLDPAKFTVAVVGNLRTFEDPRGGSATAVDIAIPPPPAGTMAVDTATLEDGKRLLQRAQTAAGGAAKLAAVKDMSMKTSYTIVRGGKDDEWDQWIAPSTLRQDGTGTQVGRLIRFTDGTNGWMSNGYASGPLVNSGLQQTIGDLVRVPVPLLLSDRLPGRTVAAIDDETIEIRQGVNVTRVVFDPKTGLPAQLHYDVVTDRGQPVLVQEILSDFRDVDGIKLPFAITVFQNGTKYAEGVVTEIKLNQGLKPEVLQKRP